MLGVPAKHVRRNNGMAKEITMTRSDVKKVAWTLRLIGCGMLVGTFLLTLLGSERTSAATGSPLSARLAR
jgi:drug/metabolite transporter (DMT)-like permease